LHCDFTSVLNDSRNRSVANVVDVNARVVACSDYRFWYADSWDQLFGTWMNTLLFRIRSTSRAARM